MKTLLVAINSKYIHSNLAVYNLRAYAKEYTNEISICEYTINQLSDSILKDIYMRRPKLVAFSCYIWNIEYVKKLVVSLHKVMPEVIIWLGGPEVSYCAKHMMEELPMVSGIMMGEGEETFLELMKAYNENKTKVSLGKIKGITYRDNASKVIENEFREPIELSKVPFAYGDKDWQIDLSGLNNRIVYYESSRGCPFSCSYCLSSIDKKIRFRDLSMVKEELKYFMDAKIKQVKFVDRTFNIDKKRSLEIWKFIRDNDNGYTNFHFEVAADILSKEEIDLLGTLRKGAVQLEIGVQSTNGETLKEIRRKMDYDKVCENVRQIKKAGNVHEHLDLIAGLPYEDYESFGRSFDDVYALRPEQLQLGFLKVLAGSYMHESADEHEIVYSSEPPYEVLRTKYLDFDDIIKLKRIEEVVEDYYNSGQFECTMEYLVKFFDSPFKMYSEIADYMNGLYKDNGVDNGIVGYSLSGLDTKHSRIDRYNRLLAWVEEYNKKFNLNIDDMVVRQLLTHDLYKRENMKTRPDFALDREEYWEEVKDFYRVEDDERRYLTNYDGFGYRQLLTMTHVERYDGKVAKHMNLHGLVIDEDSYVFVLYDYRDDEVCKIIMC